ncbi:cytochrome [Amycolatopsis antarctica]|uniref:Cytochrome n=1 Tax=Amycolatopsis antarctica TaxID=1854586 RepID=A0A263CZX9_9PSEU|nr:cytochrome P450 [Amycolatopsis antarctica]OZM71740.1 cytochrome [Amycolatopsis antarctica]
MPIPTVREFRQTAIMGLRRSATRLVAAGGDPAAKVLGHRPLPDPHPFYDEIRDRGPLYRSRLGFHVTAHHATASAVLRDPALLVLPGAELGSVDWDREPGKPVAHLIEHSLLAMNPPVHTRLRRVVAPWFTPRALRTRTEQIEKTVRGCLDELAHLDEFDLVPEFAVRVPVRVICDLLAVDDSRENDFARWGRIVGGSLDGVRSLTEWRVVAESLREMTEFFTDLIERRRAEPGEDVVSGLIAAQDSEELTARDLVATTALLLGAGFETTQSLIGNGVLALLEHPVQRAALVADPALAGNAVEEVLRWDSPVQMTARLSDKAVTVGGRELPPASAVVTLLGGANRDPEVFADPHRFDITRANARDHLAFSSGAHYCLGAGLARMEGEIALRELFGRYPDLSAAGAARRGPSRTLHGLLSLPVRTGVAKVVAT